MFLSRSRSLAASPSRSPRLPPAFQLQLSRPCSFSHLSAGPSVCARMFMRVQETRVRGYANRMIDTLAGCMPSLRPSLSPALRARALSRQALSFIPFGELISSRGVEKPLEGPAE